MFKIDTTKKLLCLIAFFTFSASSIFSQTYWEDNFDSADWKKNYNLGSGKQNMKFLPSGGYSKGGIQVTVKKGSHHGGSIKYMLKENLGFEPEELYAEYRVKYDRSMDKFGGKAPGFDGTYGKAGWGNRPGKGTNGWSARGTLNTSRQSNIRNSFYVYHTNTGNNGKTWGDAVWWERGGNMDYDKWYHVKQYIKLNTPGKKNGILKAWVNGKLVYERSNWNFRTVDRLKIYAYWFNYYNGGRDTAKKTGTLILDDFKLYGPNGLTGGNVKPVGPKPVPAPAPSKPVASTSNVSFNQPKNNQNFKVGETANVLVKMSNNNDVKEIKLYVNNAYAGRQGRAPYRWMGINQLKNLKKGSYTLKAEATLKNNRKVESTITINVGDTKPSNSSNSNDSVIRGTYYIQNVANNQNVISPKWDNYNVRMYNQGKYKDQQWSFEHIGNNIYKIKNVGTGRYLEVTKGQCANRANVKTWASAGSKHQQWIVKKQGDIFQFIPSYCTNKALDKSGKNSDNVYLWSYSKTNKNQQFRLVGVSGSKELDSFNDASLVLYPNPAKDLTNLDLTKYLDQSVAYKIHSLDGKEILSGDFGSNHSSLETIDVSGLTSGVYLLELVIDGTYSFVEKLVVDN
ncbi:RICIN domain-containing protein [Aquimarina agarivorans]|uniref:RICIN domain-containing protein n=1 Tax=Aquimarina agarivorans TaxID=980584 RepID=UPI000248F2DA|nr:RICIN domain-containing protein [Aquimarina agarivorans]